MNAAEPGPARQVIAVGSGKGGVGKSTVSPNLALVRLLPISGAVLVVTPQDVAHLDGKKAVQMFRRAKVPLLGEVENMSGFLCPHCGEPIDVLSRVPAERSIWAMGVEKLGSVPLDPVLSLAADAGRPLLIEHPDSPQVDAFRAVPEGLHHAD